MNQEIITGIVALFSVAWTISVTVYSLYMQRQNNHKYNARIVELLEEISGAVKK